MRIRIEYPDKTVDCDTIEEAGLHLLEHHRNEVDPTMGKMTLKRLQQYVEDLSIVVKRVDHQTYWKNI